jgi:2-oxoglutarate dehydrogenase E1 component
MNVFSRAYIDGLYEDFVSDPNSLPPEWQSYFQDFDPNSEQMSVPPTVSAAPADRDSSVAQLQDRVDQLVRGFRVRGHLEAHIDPLGIARPTNRELNPENYALLPSDMKRKFSARTIDGENFRTLEEIVAQLRETYCRSIGAQFMHIDDHDVRHWLQTRMEGSSNRLQLDRDTQIRILTKLTDATIFEEFMRKKYVGAKTFSLEGAETLIPLLDLLLESSGEHGVKEVVLGMAHRGRLNVLANIMGKRAENIFWGFEDPEPELNRGGGDVLYHMGYSSDWKTATDKDIHISLCFNPSHLEFVNTVAMGRVRSKQDRFQDTARKECLPVLIHGDAAFAGEGIVQETLNLSQLEAYKVGGTIHVIVNNQVGFTTLADEGRSTTYASDIAKMLQIPIFHVNGEDPEAVAQVVKLAMEFRREFQRDVVIDMYCYRRHGHNESDEPRFTQPEMYRAVDSKSKVLDAYLKKLLKFQEITEAEAEKIATDRKNELQAEFQSAKKKRYEPDTQTLGGFWAPYYGGMERDNDNVDTGVPLDQLQSVLQGLSCTPDSFNINKKLTKLMTARREMSEGKLPVDWPTAELAAFGTLAVNGHSVRLSGQDCGRGTFSQRHGVLHDTLDGKRYSPVQHITDDQAQVDIINSPLSEAGVLGFDYGYSLDAPGSLVLWEAQFGDFWNAAQVIVDQFICSAEDKWSRLSSLVMLLPHGFEGQGPEHCSARPERFLTLAAEHNIQIATPTSAAQHFHLLRRQVVRKWRKPLIVFTPKGLLRDPYLTCELSEFTSGTFQPVLGDPDFENCSKPKRILVGNGKLMVDLLKERKENGRNDVALIRLEQFYPLPEERLKEELSRYPAGTPVFWAQEEPKNMGGWYFMKVKWDEVGLEENWPLKVISRPESASPSTGSKKMHKIEHSELCQRCFGEPAKVASK